MAEMLGMHPTTLAKIEKGERSVRIVEAAAIADLFEVSLDSLLGRRLGLENDLAYSLRELLNTSKQSWIQVSAMLTELRDRFMDLAPLEFEGREILEAGVRRAGDTLMAANNALFELSNFELPPEAVVRPRKDLVELEATQMLLKMMKEKGWEGETQS